MVARLRLDEQPNVAAELRGMLLGLSESTLPGELLPLPLRDVQALATEAQSIVFEMAIVTVKVSRSCDINAAVEFCLSSAQTACVTLRRKSTCQL